MTSHLSVHRRPGGGRPIAFLHGVASRGSLDWPDAETAEIAGDRPVIVVDLPAHGESPARGVVPTSGVIDALAAAVGDEEIDLVGCSLGGRLARDLAGVDDEMPAGIDGLAAAIPGSRAQRVPSDHLGALHSAELRTATPSCTPRSCTRPDSRVAWPRRSRSRESPTARSSSRTTRRRRHPKATPEGDYDLVFATHVIHRFDAEQNAQIFRSLRAAAAAGATLTVLDFFLDDDAEQRGLDALHAGEYLVIDGTVVFPEAQVRGWLTDAGWDVREKVELPGSPRVLIATAV